MSNMSYCRFENTFRSLLECVDYFDDDDISDTENDYKTRLIGLCKYIAEEDEY